MSDMKALQVEIDAWVGGVFPGETSEQRVLVLCEEVGEVCRAVTKRRHLERGGTYDSWTQNLRDELGDVMIALCALAEREGFDLEDVLRERWATVSQRTTKSLGMDLVGVKAGEP